MLSALAAATVAGYLGSSSLLKLVAPWHLAAVLGARLPRVLSGPLASLVIGWEALLAVGLLCAPALVVVPAVATLAFFAVVSLVAAALRLEDCGCHGPWLRIPPLLSAALDLGAIALLATMAPEPGGGWLDARGAILLVVGVAVTAVALVQLRSQRMGSRPWLDLSPVREGELFRPQWLGAEAVQELSLADDTIIAFVSPRCARCLAWMKVLAKMHVRPELPRVVCVAAAEPALAELPAQPYPLLAVPRWRLAWLVATTPVAFRVSDEIVTEQWIHAMPRSLVDPLRQRLPGQSVFPAESEHAVGMTERALTVRDGDDRDPRGAQLLEEDSLDRRVEGARGFVEEQDSRPTE